MNFQKGFAANTALIVVLGVIVLGGIGYLAMNPEVLQAPAGETTQEITWQFTSAGEVEAVPYTAVTVVINGTAYEMGTFAGSCSEIGATGGIDGKGLLAGELSAAQCWFAGGGNEVGVFAHEDGGFDIMVGELGEGEEGSGMFRGNFTIKNTIPTESGTPTQGKLNINVVCESALAYMTFPDAAAAEKFVAECKAGERPEVIERYKADNGYGDGATI